LVHFGISSCLRNKQ